MVLHSNDDSISSVAALKEPARRSLYEFVVGRGGEVSRDEAAEALGMSRTLAAFHLDRLVDERLLDTTFRRLSGRSGPGAGRPAKLYRRVNQEVQVSLPPREYAFAAELMAAAIERSPEAAEALSDTAADFGGRLAKEIDVGPAAGDSMAALERLLSSHGFEPFVDAEGTLRLRNCPFHALARAHTQLVCGMNLSLMTGVARGLDAENILPMIDPQPGMCCVAFKRREE